MRKPIIGIPAKHRSDIPNDLWSRQEVVDELRYLVCKHGGIAIMLMSSQVSSKFNDSDLGDDKILSEEEIADLKAEVDLCDGIILQGGDYSDQYEVKIAEYALEKDIPLMGICAGFNNILRALGSNIYEDLSKSHSHYDKDYRHEIDVVEDSRLYSILGAKKYQVNSLHTMIADEDRVKPYAKITAYSSDGLVESFELEDKKFVLAMKWHPEIMQDDAYVDRLFEEFMLAAGKGKYE